MKSLEKAIFHALEEYFFPFLLFFKKISFPPPSFPQSEMLLLVEEAEMGCLAKVTDMQGYASQYATH